MVLLQGVNDDAEILAHLSEKLFSIGILPYYLHTLDKVLGAAHFDIPREKAAKIHWELTKKVSGYLVPKLVCEQPGIPAKMPIHRLEFCTG